MTAPPAAVATLRVEERLLVLLVAARGPSAGRPTGRMRGALAVAQLAELAQQGTLGADLARDAPAARRTLARMSATHDVARATSLSLEERGVLWRAFDAPWPWASSEDLHIRKGALDLLAGPRRVLREREPDARDAAALLIMHAIGEDRLILRSEETRALAQRWDEWRDAPPRSLARVHPYCELAHEELAW